MKVIRRNYRQAIWRLDQANHALHINWRPLCDHNERLLWSRFDG